MPKFDYIIQNPPYSGKVHLDFLNFGFNLIKKSKGKMVIINPAIIFVNVKSNNAKYNKIKNDIEGHVMSLRLENYNNEFGTDSPMVHSILAIDMSKNYKEFNFINCGVINKVDTIYDCNLQDIPYNIICNIISKLEQYPEKVSDYLYKNNPIISDDIKSLPYVIVKRLIGGVMGWFCGIKSLKALNYMRRYKEWGYQYYESSWRYNTDIMYDDAMPDRDFWQIRSTYERLNNYNHFIFNNKLPLFVNIICTINKNNSSTNLMPWITDKKYTDKEIYEMLGFTDTEIFYIEQTINRYKLTSSWFKRYMCGQEVEQSI